MAKKKQKVVAEDILRPQVPQVLTPDGSEAKKAIDIQTSVTKDDMATLIYVNVKTQLTNELNIITNNIRKLEDKRNQLLRNVREEVVKMLVADGFTHYNIITNYMEIDFENSLISMTHTEIEKNIPNQDIDLKDKLKGCVSTKIIVNDITYTNQEIQNYVKEMNQLNTSKTNIEKNLATANKEYIKANIVASLIGSSDKGEDFIKNISNIGINIIKSLKENTVPLIGISQ